MEQKVKGWAVNACIAKRTGARICAAKLCKGFVDYVSGGRQVQAVQSKRKAKD
jgi:hypothetical protein